jgi:hypothetical protein
MLSEAVRDLRGRTRGEVIEPGDGGYDMWGCLRTT